MHADSERASFSFFTFAIWTITFPVLHTFFSVKSCFSPWTPMCNKIILAAFTGKRGSWGFFFWSISKKNKIENTECTSKEVLKASAKNGCQSKWMADWRGAVSHAAFSVWGEKKVSCFSELVLAVRPLVKRMQSPAVYSELSERIRPWTTWWAVLAASHSREGEGL